MADEAMREELRELIANHWTCVMSGEPNDPACPPMAPCSACRTRAEAFNFIDRRSGDAKRTEERE